MSINKNLSYIKWLAIEIRPQQWIKNILLFPALLFSQKLLLFSETTRVFFAFILFCLLSSSIYILNDIIDIEKDKVHPTKCKRPIASGQLPVFVGVTAFIIFSGLSLLGAWKLSTNFFYIALAYLLLQIAYSTKLKHIVILDVFCIATGFVLRAIAGGVAINIEISTWLLICTLLLSLFLAFGKRRHEILLLEKEASIHRQILNEYSPLLLDQMISVVTAATVVCYALYTISSETAAKFPGLKFTIPFVLYGIFRYMYLIYQKNQGGSPEKTLLNDIPSITNFIFYAVASGLVIYVRRA